MPGIEFGPLTREDFITLASSFHDGGGVHSPVNNIARQRGMTRGDLVRLEMAEMQLRKAKDQVVGMATTALTTQRYALELRLGLDEGSAEPPTDGYTDRSQSGIAGVDL